MLTLQSVKFQGRGPFKTLILISPVVFPQGKILAKIWLKILRRLDKQVGGKTSAELL